MKERGGSVIVTVKKVEASTENKERNREERFTDKQEE